MCASPSFWLRRCSSAPMPTAGDELDGNEVEILPGSRRECSEDPEIPSKGDEYPSDKENWQPGNTRRKSLSWDGKQSCRSSYLGDDRQPFAVLQADSKPVFPPSPGSSPESDIGSRRRSLGLPPPQRPATSALVHKQSPEPHLCSRDRLLDERWLFFDGLRFSKRQIQMFIVPNLVLASVKSLKY